MKTDTIAAISTPRGVGGVAVIRISGDEAIEIADRVFSPKNKKPLSETKSSVARYGAIMDGETQIDDGIFTVFRAPNSFTGENTVEISCHGGVHVTGRVLSAVLSKGARPALAGEFTRRAFLSGKISLSEAEAVGDLLYAKTEGQLLLSGSASSSRLREKTEKISEELRSLIARISVSIDYPEEDLADIGRDEIEKISHGIRREISSLLSSYRTGRAVSEGIEAVITGRPNAGKSTLYNALLGEDAAIVTDIAGTTRDTLTSEVSVGRVMLRLSDTAGIRETDDVIESMGVERAKAKAASAELIMALFDASSKPTEEDEKIFSVSENAKLKLAIINKMDTAVENFVEDYKKIAASEKAAVIFTSLKENEGERKSESENGISEIVKTVEDTFTDPEIELGRDAVIANARQAAEASAALDGVDDALKALDDGMPVDIVSCELEAALSALMRLEGRDVTDSIIHEIFSKFCVGK